MRADLVFSYWIFIWFFLYYMQVVHFSPKFALILGLIENIGMFILMLTYGTSMRTIVYFLIINSLIKIAPLYYLKEEKVSRKDVAATFLLFLLFIVWLHLNKQSLVGNMKLIYGSLLYGANKTLFFEELRHNFTSLDIL